MSLYGRTDSNANKTKAGVGIGASSQAKTVLYVDETEAQLEETRSVVSLVLVGGLISPTLMLMVTTRHKAEQLISLLVVTLNANETQADDTHRSRCSIRSNYHGSTCKLHIFLWCWYLHPHHYNNRNTWSTCISVAASNCNW